MSGSMTFGNGDEFARHSMLRSLLACGTYFCDAYASWQKGAVENTNGRLRRWLPQGVICLSRNARRLLLWAPTEAAYVILSVGWAGHNRQYPARRGAMQRPYRWAGLLGYDEIPIRQEAEVNQAGNE